MRFVLDNSVTMRWLFGDGTAADLAYAGAVLTSMEQAGSEALVPAIWGLEAANVIARAESKGLLTEARSTEFVGLLQKMAIAADGATSGQALGATLQLARRHGLSAYDASYLELALRHGFPLATLDLDLRKAMSAAGVPLMQGSA